MALKMAPVTVSMPSIAFKPSPAPATFPILNARPPNTISTAKTIPSPGNTLFAISCPRRPETTIMRQTFICAKISSKTDTKITNPKLASNCSVKTVVCVKNPGPIDEVAIKNAAPSRTLRLAFCVTFSPIVVPPKSNDTP